MSPRFKDDEGRQIKNKTREKLVTAAAEIFARDGYEKASVDHDHDQCRCCDRYGL